MTTADLKQSEEKLKLQNAYLSALHDTSIDLIRRLDITELLQAILKRAADLVQTRHAYVYLYDEKEDALVMDYGTGFYHAQIGYSIKPGVGVAGKAWSENRVVKADDYRTWDNRDKDPRWNAFRSVAGVPLRVDDRMAGVIGLAFVEEEGKFGETEMEILSRFGDLASIALERAELYKQLEKSRERFRNTFEYATIGMCLTDPDGRFLMVNQCLCETLGYAREELLTKSFQDVTHPEDAEISKGHMQALLQGKTPSARFQKRYIHRAGHTVWAAIGVFMQRDDAGAPRYFITHVQDVTRARMLEEKLLQRQKLEAMGSLAGGIAHDFNNILFAVIGYAELSLDDVPEGTALHDNLSEILKASLRARDMVQRILTFSRGAGAAKKPVDFRSVAAEALTLMRSALPADIRLEQRLSAAGTVLADATQIHQIIVNLCANAFHAVRENDGDIFIDLDRVEMSARQAEMIPDMRPGPYLRFRVRDTGEGMTPAVMKRIFDPYFTTREVGQGSGLGLSVIDGILRDHNGHITAESAPGEGSVFTVYFPVFAPAAGAAAADNADTQNSEAFS